MFKGVGYFSICLVVVIIAIVAINQCSRYFWQNPAKDAVAEEFVVQDGQSFVAIAQALEDQQIIANALWFRIKAELAGLTDKVQAGTYIVYVGEDYKTTLAILTAGTTEGIDVRVTIAEGLTLKQIGELLETKQLVTQAEWAVATGVDSPLEPHGFVMAAQKNDDVNLEVS